MAVTSKDLSRVLDTVQAMNGTADGRFERALLTAARDLIDCDTVSYNEHHLGRGEELACYAEPTYVERSPTRAHYLRHLTGHPPVHGCATGRLLGGDCLALSDMVGAREYHALPIYAEYFRGREVEDQLVAVVRAHDARSILVVFSRSRRGFSWRERDTVGLLLPHVQQAARLRHRLETLGSALALRGSSAPLGPEAWASLTQRERDVVACLATGATDVRIARTLAISPRTVGKHLENVYRKTNLPGRTALLAALSGVTRRLECN